MSTYKHSVRTVDFGYLCAAVFAIVTLPLLFRPWLIATGPNGRVSSDAFGRLDGQSGGESGWAADPYNVDIGGTLAVLAAIAAVGTVLAAVLYFRTRGSVWSYGVLGGASSLACCVLLQVLYLNGKAPALRGLTDRRDGLGNLWHALSGGGYEPDPGHAVSTAGLAAGALYSGVAALCCALSAAMGAVRKHGHELRPATSPRPGLSLAEMAVALHEQQAEPEYPDQFWAESVAGLEREFAQHGGSPGN